MNGPPYAVALEHFGEIGEAEPAPHFTDAELIEFLAGHAESMRAHFPFAQPAVERLRAAADRLKELSK